MRGMRLCSLKADGLTAKVSFHDSPRSSSPSVTGEWPASGETSGPPTNRCGPSNLTRANVKAAAAAAEQRGTAADGEDWKVVEDGRGGAAER